MEDLLTLTTALCIFLGIVIVIAMIEDIIATYFPELPEKILRFWKDGEKE